MGSWVHEDDVFREAGLPLRTDCKQSFSEEQNAAMNKEMDGFDSLVRYNYTDGTK